MSPRWKASLVLVATFLLGAVAGVGTLHALRERRFGRHLDRPWPEARERFMLDAMTNRLDLDEGQRGEIERILETHRPERNRLFEKCAPEHEALQKTIHGEIREVLTPRQRVLHDRFMRHRGKHRGKHPGHP